MEIERRGFLWCLTGTVVGVMSAPAGPRGANNMYGLIVKLTAAAGKRDEVIGALKESTRDMPGCLSYVIAEDPADENAIWVTEVWDSPASHDASLSLAPVKNAMVQVKPRISNFERIAVTTPVACVGLRSANAR